MTHYILRSSEPVPKPLPENFDAGLNDSQKEVVYFNEGALLVVAGAGSGKTKTLVHRVARLIHEGVAPQAILLLTFTRKAAQEMLKRASAILDERCNQVSGGTFHAFAVQILRQYGPEIGYGNTFTIMDRGDQEDMLAMIRKDYTQKSDKRFPKKNVIASILSKGVNTQKPLQKILMEDYPQYAEFEDELEKITTAYDTYKQLAQVMDYDDLLVKLLQLLNRSDRVKEILQNRYRYILVDEYQDTNHIQSQIVIHLAGQKANVMAVGDDAQSIYSFRGANYENMMKFPSQFPDSRVITLAQNYRSNQPILDLTNAVISQAKESYSKQLFSEIQSSKKPVYIEAESENVQSRFICQRILELREEGVPLQKIAVLIRSGWHSNELEVALTGKNIPFVKVGGFKFVETSHVKDVTSYLKVIFNPSDQVSWNRFLLLIEGIGPKAASQIIEALNDNPIAPRGAVESFVKGKSYEKDVLDLMTLIYDRPEDQSVVSLIDDVMSYYKPIFRLTYDDYTKRESDLLSLKTIAENYSSLEKFLTEMTLDPPMSTDDVIAENKDDEHITISTIHSAKGLEWHTVFLISCVDGYLPSFQSLADPTQLEEERRLLYVALTRARENLFIVKPNLTMNAKVHYQYSGMQFSKVSRFLEEGLRLDNFVERMTLIDEQKRSSYAPTSRYGSGYDAGDDMSYRSDSGYSSGGGYSSGSGYQSGSGYSGYRSGSGYSSKPSSKPGYSSESGYKAPSSGKSNLPSYLRGKTPSQENPSNDNDDFRDQDFDSDMRQGYRL